MCIFYFLTLKVIILRNKRSIMVLRFTNMLNLFVVMSLLIILSLSPKVLGATITCQAAIPCDGTDNRDTMTGTDVGDLMRGR